MVTSKVELDGADRISQIRLFAGADGNGNRRIDHAEWTLVGTASQETNGAAPSLLIPESEIADDVVAFRVEVEGLPFKATFSTMCPAGIECDDP
jgi:hypothetical protein